MLVDSKAAESFSIGNSLTLYNINTYFSFVCLADVLVCEDRHDFPHVAPGLGYAGVRKLGTKPRFDSLDGDK